MGAVDSELTLSGQKIDNLEYGQRAYIFKGSLLEADRGTGRRVGAATLAAFLFRTATRHSLGLNKQDPNGSTFEMEYGLVTKPTAVAIDLAAQLTMSRIVTSTMQHAFINTSPRPATEDAVPDTSNFSRLFGDEPFSVDNSCVYQEKRRRGGRRYWVTFGSTLPASERTFRDNYEPFSDLIAASNNGTLADFHGGQFSDLTIVSRPGDLFFADTIGSPEADLTPEDVFDTLLHQTTHAIWHRDNYDRFVESDVQKPLIFGGETIQKVLYERHVDILQETLARLKQSELA